MTEEQLPYPKAIFFIVSNEFCERFCYYGMRTILVLYLTDKLRFAEADAKITYHSFNMFVYFFPMIGGIISDSWLGKFNTIFYVSMIYVCGCVLLAVSAVDPLMIPRKEFSLLALFLIAVGTGGIKPCVSAFGGDQFTLPQQEAQLATFFSLFYFAINAGSLLSTFLTPILRNDIHCLGSHSCYPLAFGVPGIMMILAIVIFAMGKPLYKIKEQKSNVVVNVVTCVSYALCHRITENPGNHWLDRSSAKYGDKLVHDIKILLNVLVMYIPLPVFWALFDQQGSGWIFQAVRMNGDCGFYTILPDQMQVVNPCLILIFIPLFSYIVYPSLAKCHLLRKPLQKICCGGFLAAASFAISACVSIALERTYPVPLSEGEAQIRIYDPTNCKYSFSTANGDIPGGEINGYNLVSSVKVSSGHKTVNFTFFSNSNNTDCKPKEIQMDIKEKTAYGIYVSDTDAEYFIDNIKKSDDGYPLVRTLTSNKSSGVTYTYVKKGEIVSVGPGNTNLRTLGDVGKYLVEEIKQNIEFKLGGTYTVLINQDLNNIRQIVVTQPNSVHILWLLPQYIVITAAEIMFSITGLEFSYSEAPASMKAVLQACFMMTTSIGNLLVVFIEALKIFELQSLNFFLYAGLMTGDMLIFMFLAIAYKHLELQEASDAQ